MATKIAERLGAVYVADLVCVEANGDDTLWNRKIYLSPSPAKAMATNWRNRLELRRPPDYRSGGLHNMGYGAPPFASARIQVYAITPSGYEDIVQHVVVA